MSRGINLLPCESPQGCESDYLPRWARRLVLAHTCGPTPGEGRCRVGGCCVMLHDVALVTILLHTAAMFFGRYVDVYCLTVFHWFAQLFTDGLVLG